MGVSVLINYQICSVNETLLDYPYLTRIFISTWLLIQFNQEETSVFQIYLQCCRKRCSDIRDCIKAYRKAERCKLVPFPILALPFPLSQALLSRHKRIIFFFLKRVTDPVTWPTIFFLAASMGINNLDRLSKVQISFQRTSAATNALVFLIYF